MEQLSEWIDLFPLGDDANMLNSGRHPTVRRLRVQSQRTFPVERKGPVEKVDPFLVENRVLRQDPMKLDPDSLFGKVLNRNENQSLLTEIKRVEPRVDNQNCSTPF